MPRARLIPYGDFERLFKINNEQFSNVDKAYGHRLDKRTLVLMFFATYQFSASLQIANSATSKAAVQKIKRLQKLVASLRKDFPRNRNAGRFRGRHAAQLISDYKEAGREFIAPYIFLESFAELLEENESIIAVLLAQLQSQDAPELVEGSAWNLWIFNLRKILQEACLPVEVRKDGVDSSPFVRLISELQNQFPDTLKAMIKKRSLESLSQAMTRALDEFSFCNDVSAENMIKLCCGALRPVTKGDQIAFVAIPGMAKAIDDLLIKASRGS